MKYVRLLIFGAFVLAPACDKNGKNEEAPVEQEIAAPHGAAPDAKTLTAATLSCTDCTIYRAGPRCSLKNTPVGQEVTTVLVKPNKAALPVTITFTRAQGVTTELIPIAVTGCATAADDDGRDFSVWGKFKECPGDGYSWTADTGAPGCKITIKVQPQ